MAQPKVFLTRRWPGEVEDELARRYALTRNDSDTPLSKDALADAMRTHDAVCPTVTDKMDPDVIAAASNGGAKVIGNFGVGFDHINLNAARAAGVVVTNTPGVLTDATADIAMTLMLMAARRASEGARMVRGGRWEGWSPTQLMGLHVTGKTIGLVGFGRIAQATARRAHHGFGMRVIYNGPSRKSAEIEAECGATYVKTLDELLEQADVVSLHCPGGAETHHLIGRNQLKRMKSSAILVNTARGGVIDSDALVDALTSGEIAAAGLDVYENEPVVPDALKPLENAVLLPHLGSATVETRVAMGMRVVENLDRFFAGEEPRDRVV